MGLDACREGRLFGTGVWDCLEATGNSNRRVKQRQNADKSFSVEISIGVSEKIVTFWPEAVVAPLRRPPWGCGVGAATGWRCALARVAPSGSVVSGPLASFAASWVSSVRDRAR